MKYNYVLLNGSVITRESWLKDPEEWILQADQAIRADFFASGNRIPFLEASLRILTLRFQSVGWELPIALSYPMLLPKFEKLLNKNRSFKGTVIHLVIMPVEVTAGLDGTKGFQYLAFTEERPDDFFPLNSKGLAIGISSGYRNSGEPFYSSMVRSRIRSLLIREECVANGWDEILLLDPKGRLSEASSANVFLRIKDRVVTPGPENNCFPRLMTGITKNLIIKAGLNFTEVHKITPEDLGNAEEVFLTDDLYGIRWVLSYENKRYYRKVSSALSERLKDLVQRTDQFSMGSSG
ncbi:MAG: hypothetical protein A2X22_11430 [Bacteroidetes bacterium GWF2_49_14]|nr:MAG: hypothetical protein A2X22_11430 [Bacteroidetes bacterium GWF2_49_14]HBB90737.1 hypothetical protein [Bacteroidales bacterium]